MEKNVLRAIDGIALYPLISFGIFGLFFLVLLAYAVLVKSDFIDQMSRLPLQGDDTTAPQQQGGAPC